MLELRHIYAFFCRSLMRVFFFVCLFVLSSFSFLSSPSFSLCICQLSFWCLTVVVSVVTIMSVAIEDHQQILRQTLKVRKRNTKQSK